MEAFEAAIRLGADLVEVDVRRSRDGHLVLLHDPRVERTTDGVGAVAELSLAELRDLDAGSWFSSEFAGARVPTAEAAMELVLDHGLAIVFDIKGPSGEDAQLEDELQPEVAADVARLIAARGAERSAVIASFSHPALAAARRAVPSVELAPWMPEDRPARPVEDVAATRALGARIMVHTHSLLTPELMAAVREAHIALWAWTTTDRASLDACVRHRPDAVDGGDVVAIADAIGRAFGARPGRA
jgi:glycerophosphoryl diester phosphodiesterase